MFAVKDDRRIGSRLVCPVLDGYATDQQVVAAVPSIHLEDLEPTEHGNTRTLSCTIQNVTDWQEARTTTWYLWELPSDSFCRRTTVPFAVNVD